MSKVSIVIPTFNRSDLLPKAIDSALAQTHNDYEIIVIDDGSTDNTKQVCERYPKIRYLYKPNGGIGSALNHGIKNMEGEWFKWLSSDDELFPDAVRLLLKQASETGSKIVYSNYIIIDSDGNTVKEFIEPPFESHLEFASALWTRFIGNAGGTLIHKSCFDKVGLFNESLRSAEDYDWWLRACLIHKYEFMPISAFTLKYRIHGNQLTEQVKHNAIVLDEQIRSKIKDQILASDPGWWNVLEDARKTHAKKFQRGGLLRRMARKSLIYMPEGVRKKALTTWQNTKHQ